MSNILSRLLSSAQTQSTLPVSFSDICAAQERIGPHLSPTPLTFSPRLSELLEREIFLKWENKHRTGSFKERGALNFLLSLSDDEKARGVCAASAGNHALAVSYYAAKFGVPCHIVMPTNAPLVKVSATKKTGAEVTLFGTTFNDAYGQAQTLSRDRGYRFVSAFDDPAVIAGQGTAGLEICNQLEEFDSVVVPVGGGGLMSGIALAIRELRPQAFLLGAQSLWAVQARESPTQVHQPLAPVTIADGIAVKTVGALTSQLLPALVNKLAAVDENEIARAILLLLEHEKSVVEGAGAAGLAALRAGHLPKECARTVVVISGSNIDMNLLSRLIERGMAEAGRLLRVTVSVPDAPGSLYAAAGVIAKKGANVLQVYHERSHPPLPGDVDVTFLVEVKDSTHISAVLAALAESGLAIKQQSSSVSGE